MSNISKSNTKDNGSSIFKKELDMQEWLRKELNECYGLSDLIINCVDNNASTDAERKINSSYEYCLKSLDLTEVISEDKNISLKKGDVLRPDFLLYSVETESIIIVELKNISNPTRQVGTEISAYASEVKSYLPFIASGDIISVIISSTWPTLLRHFLFNEIFWLQKKILCLYPVEAKGKIRLKIKNARDIIENDVSIKLQDDCIGGYQICLYHKDIYHPVIDFKNYLEQMRTALLSMSVKGNSLNNHGFAFLWKDNRRFSIAPYSITILNFSSFQSFGQSFNRSDTENYEISKRFLKIVNTHSPMGHGQSLDEITEHSQEFLSIFCNPMVEGYHYWYSLKEFMLENSDLLAFTGWGIFGELYSDLLSEEYKSGNMEISSTDPRLGLKLINRLVETT